MKKYVAHLVCALLSLYPLLVIGDVALYQYQNRFRREQIMHPTFATQFLHPYYFFFFPLPDHLRQLINSETTWVDKRGFRGPGPEAKGQRKLAVLLGGSTAFGHGASNNDQTLTGALNRLQQEFFFVNAGVPAWNSFQELLRFLKQIAPLKPKLVVDLNGYNDAAIAYGRTSPEIPPDAPQNFEQLWQQVEDIRSGVRPEGWLERAWPWIRHLRLANLREWAGPRRAHAGAQDMPVHHASDTAKRYLENMDILADQAKRIQARFVVLFQPFRYVRSGFGDHDALNAIGLDGGFPAYYLAMRETLRRANAPYWVDMSEAVPDLRGPISTPEAKKNAMFIDAVHLNDRGYQFLAERIWREIQSRR